jgi:hypothetical protein
MTKNYFIIAFFILFLSESKAQVAFTHVTSSSNTSGHITTLDHPQLNSNPNAVVFIAPVWESRGDQNFKHTFGVWYDASRSKWTIFNQNLMDMDATTENHFRFNVLVFPRGTDNTHVHTVTSSNKSFHITTLDHPLLNNNPEALITVTQLYGVYNTHEIGVWYSAGRWKIFNQDRTELPVSAKFNIFIGTAGIIGAHAIKHTHTSATKISTGYTVLENSVLNENKNFRLFVTQRYTGVYNPNSYTIWYDDPAPTDAYHYKDGRWLLYHAEGQEMPLNASFNILALPKGTLSSESKLRLTIRTGGDDLRSGSQAFCTFRTNSRLFRSWALNNSANWGNGSTNVIETTVPPATTALTICTLQFLPGSSGPLDTGDNWNVDYIKLELINAEGNKTLAEHSGGPIVRFTGSTREYRITLR